MTAQEDALAAKMSIISSIAKEARRRPIIPMEKYCQEAGYLHKWCQPDRAPLTKAGLDWALVDDLPVRTLAAMEAQSKWHNIRFDREETRKRWALESPFGYELRDELLHVMRYAFRNDPVLLSGIDAVAEGTGDADMIQDLNDLAVIGRANLPKLVLVGFEEAKLVTASEKSVALGTLRADSSVDKKKARAERILRDQAYTHLKEAVDEIRQCGQFVFWKNPERAQGYASDYKRKSRSSKDKPADAGFPSPAQKS